MEKVYVCTLDNNEATHVQNLVEMRAALHSLAYQISSNNDILKKDSDLYSRLISDYKEVVVGLEKFWAPYRIKYDDLIDDNSQLSIDFQDKSIYKIPLSGGRNYEM